ncbi:SWPV1-242 [Shearwaterpox virus]|uniref:SWPV1-242 n=1 Tax=Shearwaterpox virus TaxID=1974596 RepID=A0A1V0QGZ0_CNPV|nr:SWPV1-242 [Shearwaterpox virus]
MEIFELILEGEKFFNKIPLILPKKKNIFTYKDVTFIFFLPSDKKIDYYMYKGNLHYSDFIVYGEVIIDETIMLLIHLDFKYYGITKEGKTKYLGKSIKDLKMRETKKWKEFTY